MRHGYERWNATGRLPVDLLDPEIEWRNPVGHQGEVRGPEEVAAALADAFESFEYIRNAPQRILARGDRVVVIVETEVRGRGSGVTFTNRAAHVWTVRGGKLWRLRVYNTKDEALKAVGLEE